MSVYNKYLSSQKNPQDAQLKKSSLLPMRKYNHVVGHFDQSLAYCTQKSPANARYLYALVHRPLAFSFRALFDLTRSSQAVGSMMLRKGVGWGRGRGGGTFPSAAERQIYMMIFYELVDSK